MQIPILQTRLNPPILPDGLVSRPDLMSRISMGTKHKLTLLSAPAGYGKTTLVGQWLHKQERTFIWLSLDKIHRDSRVFMQYILSAMSMRFDIFNNPFWQIPQQQQEWNPLYLLGHLINKIEKSDIDLVFVLDDYHVIDSAEISEIFGFFLENLPCGINVIITSRTDPDLQLAKMRAKQELMEINSHELKFSLDEAERLLPGFDINEIHIQSEGWITGIQLALLGRKRNTFKAKSLVKDYLFEELLEKQDKKIVSFLYKTSILTYLNTSLCDAIIPENNTPSEEILKELLKNNFFIQKVDIEGEWFRLHPLLLDVLIEKRDCDVHDLHIRAAKWFWDREQYRESFNHFLGSQDYSITVDYLEKCWPLMEQNFNFLPWIKWAEEIPDNLKIKHPLFMVQIAWARLHLGQLSNCEISLKKVEKLLSTKHSDKSLLVQISSVWSYLFLVRRDLENTIKNAEIMENLTDKEDYFALIQAKSYIALAHWLMGNLDSAFYSIENFRDEMIALGVPAFALGSYLGLIQIRLQQGRNRDALILFEEAIEFQDGSKEILAKVKASLYLRAATICFEQGDLEAMNQHLTSSESLAAIDSLVDYHYQWHQFIALIYECDKKWDKALHELDEAEHLFIQTPAIDDLSIEEQKIRIWIRMKKKTIARKALMTLIIAGDPVPSFQNESRLLIKIRYSLTFYKDPEELQTVLKLLNQLCDIARREGRLRSLAEILILTTNVMYKLKKTNEAYAVLLELLSLAEQNNFIQLFLLEKDNLEPIFREFSSRLKTIDTYVQVRDYIDDHSKKSKILSTRELEILKLMALGLSNKEIGEKLFVAESTIKGHNQRIFQKLNVTKRTEAIVEGHNIGLLG